MEAATTKEIYIEVKDRQTFMNYLKENDGIMVFKFGAEWCRPCRNIQEDLEHHFANSHKNIYCFDLNVDMCVDVYSFLKQKRQINGIPAILAYKKDNKTFAPDLSHTGSNKAELANFFNKLNIMAESM